MSGFTLFTTVFGIVGTACAIVFGYLAFRRNSKTDDTAEGKKDGVLLRRITGLTVSRTRFRGTGKNKGGTKDEA